MKTVYILLLGILLVSKTAVAQCGMHNHSEVKHPDPTVSGTGHESMMQDTSYQPEKMVFKVEATVTEINKEKKRITIDHEKMEGYMDAMEMPYKVANPAIFDKVKVGTRARFTIEVTNNVGYITDVDVHKK